MQYELTPTNGRKSFYHKAIVNECDNGDKELYSYNTLIATLRTNGEIIRHYDGERTHNTCCHLKSFLGDDNYRGFWDLPCKNNNN